MNEWPIIRPDELHAVLSAAVLEPCGGILGVRQALLDELDSGEPCRWTIRYRADERAEYVRIETFEGHVLALDFAK